jgi:hypothetical protein
MTRLIKAFLLAIVLVMIAACSAPTPYQRADHRSGLGYSDYHVKGNIYHVYVSGVPISDKGVYLGYWHRRSKELCEGMGFQEYRVIEYKQDDGDPTPIVKKSDVPLNPRDYTSQPMETVQDYSRSASVSGEVECLKKSK